ncbi:MAG TPA: chemotaxis protein CheB [Polyangiaceae bacterium]|nr:chemotaxis protein CheB [Polyangiaceae bacterium]
MINEQPGADDALAPDASEEELADQLDNVVPTVGYSLTRVIALGGSAGGIPALRRFFAQMTASSGMAFVVILHLAPEHESSLSGILQTVTSMPVEQASNGQKVLANHVYVIPPGKYLSLTDGHLRLTELQREYGKRLTVDTFFRSLADTHGAHSVAVVLSGADGDGALGVKRIKERGGLTIAQDPDEAEHSGMPLAAIRTKMVDWVLPVEQIPERLLRYQEGEERLQLPPESGPNPVIAVPTEASSEEAALRETLAFVHARTGRDFRYYKRATIVRRIARRMQVNELDTMPAYLNYLRMHPGEAGALLQDLLISVTNFFRDRTAFEALQAQIPELFRGKTQADTVRVWVPACASGEEAYSIAMLLSEHARTLETPPTLHVFATDLDEAVLTEARNGLYPAAIANDVSAERLGRFFVKEPRGYRVRRELREMLLFAVHDLLKDSPFSRLDLLSCRNLLIYLDRAAQARAFNTFHFALRPEGRLFLGTSETADDAHPLFHVIDKKHRIYSARPTAHSSMPVPSGPSTLARSLALHEADPGATLARKPLRPQNGAGGSGTAHLGHERLSARALHLQLVEQLGPPSLVVNEDADIVHLSETASQFLRFTGGEPSTNLFRAVHPMLRVELRAALSRARQSGQPNVVRQIPMDVGASQQLVDIRVTPALTLAPNSYLITLDQREADAKDFVTVHARNERLERQLERELEQAQRHWRDVLEQHETSTEELKASNEELQAMNEELRSATEELETSREELQSINEELITVNQELKSKVDELGHANSDLRNLMGSTAIATIFLDCTLKITRFTPPAVELFSLIPTDVGRPLANLQHRLTYPELLADTARVLEETAPIEREIDAHDGRCFLARLLPYRTNDDQIAGLVLTFVDVTELHQAQEAVRRAQRELEQRVLERTAELDTVNVALRTEVTMHREAEKARQELQVRLVNAQEEERGRISRELHDEVGQQITALMLGLKSLESTMPTEQTPIKLRELRAAAEQVGKEIHLLASALRPAALDELGLSRALSGFLDSWAARNGISVDFLIAGIDEQRLPSVTETTLYRVVQEAMNNVFKHATAKSVSVSVERRGTSVLAIVEDDGAGFDVDAAAAQSPARLGIAVMRERAAIAGGTLTIESRPGSGTTVRLLLPLPSTDATQNGGGRVASADSDSSIIQREH